MPRWATATLVVLLVLAALVWGLDRLARNVSESLVADTIRNGGQSTGNVDVGIQGTFFAPQVVSGDYSHVNVVVQNLSAQGLTIAKLSTDLYGVHLPLGRVVSRNVHSIPVDRSRERAVISYRALNRYVAAQGHNITLSQGNGGEVTVTTHIQAFGTSFPLGADAKIIPGHSYLDVEPTRVHTGSSILDTIGDAALKVRLAFRIPMNPLPFGQDIQSVTATGNGLVVVATGQHIVLTDRGTVGTAGRLRTWIGGHAYG